MPKRLSPSDPAAHYTSAHGGKADFCHATNYLVDVKHAVIMDVEASTAVRRAKVTAARRMIQRVHDDLGIWPRKLIGDTGYGSAETLAWLDHEQGIEPHIPFSTSRAGPTAPSPRRLRVRHRRRHLHLSCEQAAQAPSPSTSSACCGPAPPRASPTPR